MKLESDLTRNGSPEQDITVNGPQFTAEEFALVSKNWDFEHQTSSPAGNNETNGKAESAVKQPKKLGCYASESDSKAKDKTGQPGN
mgnify:FL=1